MKFAHKTYFLVFVFAFLLVFSTFFTHVYAHELFLVNVEITILDKTIDIQFILPENRSLDSKELFDEYARESISVSSNGTICSLENINFKSGLPTVISMQAICQNKINNFKMFSSFFADEGYAFSVSVTKGSQTKTAMLDDVISEIEFTFDTDRLAWLSFDIPIKLWQMIATLTLFILYFLLKRPRNKKLTSTI